MRRAWVLLLLPLLLSLTGCWDRVEINDLAIVGLVGIDTAEQGIQLTVNVVVPSKAHAGEGKAGSAAEAVITYKTEATSVMDAVGKLQRRLSRRLFWGHTQALVIGEAMARAGVAPVLDYWSRHREVRPLMQVMVTPGTALQVLQARPRLEALLAQAIRDTMLLSLKTRSNSLEFLQSMRTPGTAPMVPMLDLVSDTGGPEVAYIGMAVFQQDRMAGRLDSRASLDLLLLHNEAQPSVLTVKLPAGGTVGLVVYHGHTVIRPVLMGQQLRIAVELKADSILYESTVALDPDKEETIAYLESLLATQLQEHMLGTLANVQRWRADVLAFGQSVARKYPLRWEQEWKEQWPQQFAAIPVDVQVHVRIPRNGKHGAPLGATEPQIKKAQEKLLQPKD